MRTVTLPCAGGSPNPRNITGRRRGARPAEGSKRTVNSPTPPGARTAGTNSALTHGGSRSVSTLMRSVSSPPLRHSILSTPRRDAANATSSCLSSSDPLAWGWAYVGRVEGITSPDGRVFGKMGHSERKGYGLYKNVDGNFDIKMFDAAVKYFK